MKDLTIGQCATLACVLEVTAPKPGNVHRGADFDDATLNDFLASAVAIGPAMEEAKLSGVGKTVLAAVRATRAVTATNTNLGSVLLIAPLAGIARDNEISIGVSRVLEDLSPQDACDVYAAIRIAQPGGLGKAPEMDVAGAPPQSLLNAMQAAADRDLVAKQYVNGFHEVLKEVVPAIVSSRLQMGLALPPAIVHAQMQLMSRHPDSLIARKGGLETARQSAVRAQRVLESGSPGSDEYAAALDDFDFWLRSDGRRRNPGTTADLLGAGLFVCLRDGLIGPPFG
jgi:triphosphoribosyl-dephospho-CoA synthase